MEAVLQMSLPSGKGAAECHCDLACLFRFYVQKLLVADCSSLKFIRVSCSWLGGWLGLPKVSYGWLGLARAGWDRLGLAVIGWGWEGSAGVG